MATKAELEQKIREKIPVVRQGNERLNFPSLEVTQGNQTVNIPLKQFTNAVSHWST